MTLPPAHALPHQRAYFESLAGRYADGYAIGLPFLAHVHAAISPHVHGRVLDIGNGGLANWDLARASSIVFADLCSSALVRPATLANSALRAISENELGRIARTGANVLALPFADRCFDVVLLLYVAHHLSVASRTDSLAHVRRALDEIRRVLAPGGTLLLLENEPALPCQLALDLAFPLWFRLLARRGKPLPCFLSRRELTRMLADAGFALVATQRIPWARRVHQPLFPGWSPPGWLWEWLLGNRLFVARAEVARLD